MDFELEKLLNLDLRKLILFLNDSDVLKIRPYYRGEGNDNMVFSIPGINYVMRFRKGSPNKDRDSENEELKISFIYHNLLVKCIFGKIYSAVPIYVEVSPSAAGHLDASTFDRRPDTRKEKRIGCNVTEAYPDFAFVPVYNKYLSATDHSCLKQAPEADYLKNFLPHDYAMYRNFVFSLLTDEEFRCEVISNEDEAKADNWCVEIKPKRGVITPYDLSSEICIFCMNQFYKLETGKASTRSFYCPLDLFSGYSHRMKRALKELLKVPQNNLRIFKNGELVFGDACSESLDQLLAAWFENNDFEWCTNNFCDLIIKILTHESTAEGDQSDLSVDLHANDLNLEDAKLIPNVLEPGCHQENLRLPKNSILNRILSMQKLNTASFQTTYDFYLTQKNKYRSELDYVYDLCYRFKSAHGTPLTPKLNILEAYLLAAAANDLSVLIAIKRLGKEADVSKVIVEDLKGIYYEVNVSVVDVGPKPISTIEKHHRRNENILRSFQSQKRD